MVILINQIRDNMRSRLSMPVYDSPGGHALKHSALIRIQLKPGKERYLTKIDGNDVLVGREIVAHILRNKMSEGTGRRALFDYYPMETDTYPFGVDKGADILNVGLRTGVIQRTGGWYYYDDFPNGKLNGGQAVKDFLKENPKVYQTIRERVLEKMRNGKE